MSPSSPGYSNFIVFIDGVYSPKIANLFIKKLKNNEFIIRKEYKTQHPSINYVSFIINTNFEWSLIGVTKSLIQSYVPSVVPIWSLSRIPYYINKIAYFKQVLLHFNVPTPVKINNFNFIVCPCLYKECLNAYYCGIDNIQNIAVMIFTSPISKQYHRTTTLIHLLNQYIPNHNYVSNLININFEWSLIGVTKSLIQIDIPSVVPIWSLSRIPYYINKIAYFKQVLLHFNVPTPVKINNFNFIVCPCLYKECLNAYYCGTNIQNITFSIFTLSANSNQYPSTTPIHSSINNLNFIFSIYDCSFQISSPSITHYLIMCFIYYLKCLLSYQCPVTDFWFVLGLFLPGQYQFLINSIY